MFPYSGGIVDESLEVGNNKQYTDELFIEEKKEKSMTTSYFAYLNTYQLKDMSNSSSISNLESAGGSCVRRKTSV